MLNVFNKKRRQLNLSPQTNKIFVSIASYCDSELIPTLHSILNNAAYPENLRIVVCLQDTEETLAKVQSTFPQIEIIFIPFKEGKGVSFARHLIQQKVENEPYYLQLDSHHRMVNNWDILCFEMYFSLPNKKKLLTSYLPIYDPENPKLKLETDPYILKGEYFYDNDKLRIQPHALDHSMYYNLPVPGFLFSAHFVFCEINFVKEVPYDPQLYFEGEEDTLSVRAFTHGYQIYHPNRIVGYHFYTRENHTRHTDVVPEWVQMHELSLKRMRILTGMIEDDGSIGKYGHGTKRKLSDFVKESQIYFKNKLIAKSHLSNVLNQNCWTYSTGFFKRTEQRRWIEYIDNTAVNAFDEIEHTAYNLILFDAKRNMWVKISHEAGFFKNMEEDQISDWVMFTNGNWEQTTLISYMDSEKEKATLPQISYPNKKIALVSLRTPQTLDWAVTAEVNQRFYCKKNGYSYIFYDDIPIKSEIPHWNKVTILLEHLSNYEWLVWIDSDAIFTNINQKLEEVIAKAPDKDLLVCDDIGGWTLNTGVMFLRNCEWTRNIFTKLWCMEHVPHSKAAEQSSLIHLLNIEDPEFQHWKVFPQTEFNTHPKAHTGKEFILHMMGLGGEERYKTFSYWNNKLGVK